MSAPAALEWLEARAPAAPAALRERMAAALAAAPETETVPGALAQAALSCLEAALARGSDRAAAADLLAADALLTYAMEAAAEAGADALERLAAAYDPARLAALLGEAPA